MIQYGLISEVDARTIEKSLVDVINEFPEEPINTCEIGIFNGQTSRGVRDFLKQHNREHVHVAIDSNKDFPVEKPYPECALVIGNSMEVYNRIPDDYLHFSFCDANHSFPFVIADYFCYRNKIKKGGMFLFHDCGEHIQPYRDYQRCGDEGDADFYISVRKALREIGLLDNKVDGWELIYDEADVNDACGGIVALKRIK